MTLDSKTLMTEQETKDQYNDIMKAIEELDLKSDSNLTENQQRQVREFLRKNVKVFSLQPKEPTRTTTVKHHIHTGDIPPIQMRPYRLSFKKDEHINKEMDEMLKSQVIRRSNSP